MRRRRPRRLLTSLLLDVPRTLTASHYWRLTNQNISPQNFLSARLSSKTRPSLAWERRVCPDAPGIAQADNDAIVTAGSPCRQVNAGRGDDGEPGCAVDATAHQVRSQTTQEKTPSGLRSPRQEGRKAKKWGGDGHITSPTSSAPGENLWRPRKQPTNHIMNIPTKEGYIFQCNH